jgi:hypothetical protein
MIELTFTAPTDVAVCRIEEIKGTFARCGNPSDRQPFTIGRREPPDRWVNVAVAESLTKVREQR